MSGEQKQYDCIHCKRPFRGADGVMRIRCPHCRQTNIVMIPVLPGYVLPSVPQYTLAEARDAALNLLNEPVTAEGGWEEVPMSYEGVSSCQSRVFCVNENYDELFCSKAISHEVNCTLDQILNVFWDVDAEVKVWNNSSLKSAVVLERNATNTEQLIYQERKVHASISMGGDVVFRRAYEAFENDYLFSWASSTESPLKPPQRNMRRCFILISGFYVKMTSPNTCIISSCASYYETGNVPAVAVTEECKRVALRICRIVKRIQEIVRISGLAPPTGAKFTPTHTLTQPQVQSEPINRQTSAGSAGAAPGGSQPRCPQCGAPDNGSRFCGSCGYKLR